MLELLIIGAGPHSLCALLRLLEPAGAAVDVLRRPPSSRRKIDARAHKQVRRHAEHCSRCRQQLVFVLQAVHRHSAPQPRRRLAAGASRSALSAVRTHPLTTRLAHITLPLAHLQRCCKEYRAAVAAWLPALKASFASRCLTHSCNSAAARSTAPLQDLNDSLWCHTATVTLPHSQCTAISYSAAARSTAPPSQPGSQRTSL